jgi:peptidoglycan/LPS O-acetylase OafA/YrhL
MASPAAATRFSPHIPALDGLRGLAILLVVPHNVSMGTQGIARVFTFAAGAGWIGVQLFFVLSGFLITRNLLESHGASNYYRAFFGRRLLRIFPLYFLFLFVALVVLPAAGVGAVQYLHDRSHQIWLWTFLINWTTPFGLNVVGFGQFWSLAIEEQFYAIWPLVVATWSARLLRLCLALAAGALVVRCLFLLLGLPEDTAYTFTVARMDAVALGAAVAVAAHGAARASWFNRPDSLVWSAIGLLLLGAAITRGYPARAVSTLTIGQSLSAVAFALMVMAASSRGTGWWRKCLELSWLRAVGKYSYGMYVLHLLLEMLWHEAIVSRLSWAGTFAPVLHMLAITGVSFGAAVVSYHLIETHFLRLKRWFVPS